jgi:PAS domain S-box-containing protein
MPDSQKIHLNLSAYFAVSPDLFFLAGKDGYFKKVNASVSRVLEYSEKELLARPIIDFVLEEDRQLSEETGERLFAGNGLINFVNRVVSRSGKVIWLEWTSIYFEDEEIILAIAKDITERKVLEQGVVERYNKFKTLATHFKTRIEKERKNIAYGLHENFAQIASGVKMELDLLPILFPDMPTIAKEKIEQAAENTLLLIQALQRLSFSISPKLLEDFGFTATMQFFVKEFTRSQHIPCSFTSSYEDGSFSYEVETDFFRICQEALNNVGLYSGCEQVEISIFETTENCSLSIADNGKGFELDQIHSAGGINNIKEIVASINGIFNIESVVGTGTKLTVMLQKNTSFTELRSAS